MILVCYSFFSFSFSFFSRSRFRFRFRSCPCSRSFPFLSLSCSCSLFLRVAFSYSHVFPFRFLCFGWRPNGYLQLIRWWVKFDHYHCRRGTGPSLRDWCPLRCGSCGRGSTCVSSKEALAPAKDFGSRWFGREEWLCQQRYSRVSKVKPSGPCEI